jgi:hypothetical protein
LEGKGTMLKNYVNMFSICIQVKFIGILWIIIDLPTQFAQFQPGCVCYVKVDVQI